MRRFLAIFLLAALSVHAEAQDSSNREHFFPLIADGDGFRSRLFITGVSDAANRCSLSLRGPGLDAGIFQADSAVTATGTGAEIDLGVPRGSVTLTSAGGRGLAFGYATLDCAEPTVARMLLSLENGGTPLSLATLESATPGMSFQFPVLPRLGRLAMVFSSDVGLDAACVVELENEAGASLGGGSVSVPTRSTALQFLDELIPFPDGFVAGKARVSCNRDIAALGIPLSGPFFSALPAIDLQDDSASASHILPLIQDGGGFRSRVLLTNLAESANRCTVDVRGGGLDAGRFDIPAGASASDSGIVLELAARGDQASLSSTGEQALAYGYAAVECDGPVDARNLLTVDAAGELAGMAAVSGARPADGMEFPVLPGLGQLTLAMNNDGESEASCGIELTANGVTVSSTGLFQVAGRSTLLRFLRDLFTLPDDFSGGMVRLSCYSEVSAAALLVSDLVFAAMPAAVVPIRTNPESARTIPDENLRLLISRQLGKAPGALVGPDDLSELRSLDARNAGIESLEGLQHATGMTSLNLGPAPWDPENGYVNGNRVTDLSPILGLSNLEYLNLAHNELSGPIPVELGNLTALTNLDLSGNELSGPIPSQLGGLTQLTWLWLWGNQLSGTIPAELGNLTALWSLNLNGNELSGPIPAEFGQLGNLIYMDLSNNELNGPIPSEVGQLGRLKSLYLGVNQLVGNIPEEIGGLSNLENLGLSNNELSGLIPAELGQLGNLRNLYLHRNQLSGSIPGELGQLSALKQLDLFGNELSGRIPLELGQLSMLQSLRLGNNDLSGSFPQTFLQLDELETFYFGGNEDLCVSGVSAFLTWLNRIENRTESGALCNESDRKALEYLFERTGGADWTNAYGWNSGSGLDEWHGVRTDPLGRVTALDLTQNGLSGRLSANVGNLAQLAELRVGGNPDLSGRFPLSLAELSIEALHYSGTDLCAPADFRDWLDAVPSHEGTGKECARPSDREILEFFYDVTDGPNWTKNQNWITDAPLGEWHGVEVDDQDRVTGISFVANRLKGRIPRELGDLTHLQTLRLYKDRLTGPIPADLADLSNLRTLSLGENDLTGPIPPEIGSITELQYLLLHENDFTGSIPPELGNLAELEDLFLSSNSLTGRIPAELGGLANLERLTFNNNKLTGSIPPELGNLSELRTLVLSSNSLTGRIPPELGGLVNLDRLYLGENELTGSLSPGLRDLTRLRTLALQSNVGISGILPAALTSLVALETLQVEGTGLCASSDAGFIEWLEGVAVRRVAFCEGESAMAYLVQAVQSRDFPVPLVAGEEALLRVFVTAGRENSEALPPARASFYRNGALVHTADIPAAPGPIPTEVVEESLGASVNAAVPADVVQPGLEMVVEVDPDGTLDAALGVAKRIPATGRIAVDVREVPDLDLTLVPFLWTEDSDSEVLDAVSGMAADPGGHELLSDTRTLLPVGGLTVTAHEPVLSSSNDAYHLFAETQAIRVMEGETGYYMGMMSGEVTGADGLGGGVVSFSVPDAGVIAHEFGHNFGLPHAPCGGAAVPDPAYPYADGTIGAWGYDSHVDELVSPDQFDLMGYCGFDWVGDYNFTKAFHFRVEEEGSREAPSVADTASSLLLWGGADASGIPHLNPAFVVGAAPALPDSAGAFRVIGRTGGGEELFAFSFSMPDLADGDGSSSFAFALPVEPDWSDSLASITLTGPGGSTTLDAGSDQPMAILRNPQTGRVRGILRDPRFAAGAAATAVGQSPAVSNGAGAVAGQSLEILFSRGMPAAEAWRD